MSPLFGNRKINYLVEESAAFGRTYSPPQIYMHCNLPLAEIRLAATSLSERPTLSLQHYINMTILFTVEQSSVLSLSSSSTDLVGSCGCRHTAISICHAFPAVDRGDGQNCGRGLHLMSFVLPVGIMFFFKLLHYSILADNPSIAT